MYMFRKSSVNLFLNVFLLGIICTSLGNSIQRTGPIMPMYLSRTLHGKAGLLKSGMWRTHCWKVSIRRIQFKHFRSFCILQTICSGIDVKLIRQFYPCCHQLVGQSGPTHTILPDQWPWQGDNKTRANISFPWWQHIRY